MRVFVLIAICLLLGCSMTAQSSIAPSLRLVNAGQSAHFAIVTQASHRAHTAVYLVGASFTYAPQNPIVPLMPDPMLYASIVHNNTFMFQNTYGLLNPIGLTPFIIFPVRQPCLYGLNIYLSALIYDYTVRQLYATPIAVLQIVKP